MATGRTCPHDEAERLTISGTRETADDQATRGSRGYRGYNAERPEFSMSKRIEPHGGELKILYLADGQIGAVKQESVELPSWPLTQRQLCDIKLLLNGGFSPLTYDRVVEAMRLSDGTLWPMPITLDVSEAAAEPLSVGDRLALRDHEGWLIAILTIESIWRPDRQREAEQVFGTADEEHPGVDYLLNRAHPVYLGGRLEGIEKSVEHDFVKHRHEPAELRQLFDQRAWSRVVAYQTRTPMHRAHQELAVHAAQMLEANLLVHPVVGMTQPGDIDHFSRVRCYEHVLKTFPEQTTMLSLLELAMLQPFHRRLRPCLARDERRPEELLRALCGPGSAAGDGVRDGHRDVSRQGDGLR
jgi:sulfate adenylyltransferase